MDPPLSVREKKRTCHSKKLLKDVTNHSYMIIMAAEFSTLFRTSRSELRLYDLSPEWLARMPDLAQEIDSSLDHHPAIVMYGKVCHQQRSVSFFSDASVGYRYSGRLAASIPLTPSLHDLLAYINQLFSAQFNGILINKYENGNETIGKHSDDESALDPSAGVVSLSVGAVRKFRIRHKNTGAVAMDIPTDPSKIIQMHGDFQKEFTHEIPTEKRVILPRYSFTFRKHLQ